MKKKHRFPWPVRALLWLICLAAVCYAGVFGYVCIREGSVKTSAAEMSGYNAIIVLGAQVLPDGTPNVQLSWRLDKALEAWKAHPAPIVVCGAQGHDEPLPEAEAMRKYLADRGVPEDEILMDSASFNTKQNLKNAKELLSTREVSRPLIVTSDYHVPRAMAIARTVGLDAMGLGSPCKPDYWLKNHAREALAWCKFWAVEVLHLPLD